MSKWWKNHIAMVTFSKAICCAFFFNYCILFFPVAQELLNVHNNWKSNCAWPFQLLCTRTLYLYMKETWLNIQKAFQTINADLDSPLISKKELFVTIINGFYQILIVSYKSIINVAGALYLPWNRFIDLDLLNLPILKLPWFT